MTHKAAAILRCRDKVAYVGECNVEVDKDKEDNDEEQQADPLENLLPPLRPSVLHHQQADDEA